KSVNSSPDFFNKFQSFAMQISPTDDSKMFYNNIVLTQAQKAAKKEEINQLWAAKLDTSVSMEPFLVINHQTKANEIMVQDDSKNLYLIDNSGEILWKKKLTERIKGKIYQVDY